MPRSHFKKGNSSNILQGYVTKINICTNIQTVSQRRIIIRFLSSYQVKMSCLYTGSSSFGPTIIIKSTKIISQRYFCRKQTFKRPLSCRFKSVSAYFRGN